MIRLPGVAALHRAHQWFVRRTQAGHEGGFILLESVIAIAVITVVMSAVGVEFVSATASTAHQRNSQLASQLADSALEQMRALQPTDLVTGRDPASVLTEFAAAPAAVAPWLAQMDQASDVNATAGSGASATVPTVGVPEKPGNVPYTLTEYLGWCYIPAPAVTTSTNCVKQVNATANSYTYLRAVAAVTWNENRCPAGCSYVTSTLISTKSDATFIVGTLTPLTIVDPGPQTVSIGDTVNLPLSTVTGYPPYTWSKVSGAFPGGITISTDGIISGTVTGATGPVTSTVQVVDGSGRAATLSIVWTVTPQLTITPPGTLTSTVNATLSPAIQFTATGGSGTYSWSDPSHTLPAGLTISSAGAVSGKPTAAGSSPVTISVADGAGHTATATFTWKIVNGPSVTSPGAQTDTVNSTVSVQLTSSCPNAPCTFALSTAPPGLTVNSAGLITGSPTTVGTSTVSITITDASHVTATSTAFAWTIVAKPSITAPANQTNTLGGAVNLTLNNSCLNVPCNYVLTGGPGGLTISATGVITGNITGAVQSYPSVTATVTDNDGFSTTSTAFTWAVLAAPTVTAPAAQTDTVGSAVSVQLTRTCPNSPCSYALNNGPPNLTISATGLISGTVTGTAQNYPATTVTATDANGVAVTSSAFAWTIGATIVLTTSAQASVVNVAVNPQLQLSATGGAGGPYTYSLVGSTLPPGLSLSSAGVVTGTPTTVGSYTVQIKVFDKGGKSFGTGSFTWTIGYPPLVGSVPANQVSTLNTPINPQVQLTASGGSGNYSWSDSPRSLPAGLNISTGGLITGTPTALTSATSVTVLVRDTTTGNTQTVSFTWTVVAKPTITAPAAQRDTIGDAVTLALTETCPNSPCTFTSTTLPTGLSVSSDGIISGTVAGTARTYATTVTIVDADGASVTSSAFSWTVFAQPTITTPANQIDSVGSTVNLPVTNTCTNTPCAYGITGAPAGLSMTNGSITGTITGAMQTYSNVVVTVTDAAGVSATTNAFTWTVVGPPSVTAPANQHDSAGTSVNLTLTKSCPNAPCSYTLNNGPNGLSVTSAGVITGAITGAAGTYTPVTITITDSDGLSATSASFSWQVFAAPTVTAPPAQTDTIGDSVNLTLTKTCANAPCTFAIAGAPTGLSISSAGVITGTVGGSAQTYSTTVTITDADSATAAATFVWTVFARPTITTPAAQTDTIGDSVNLTLTKSCSNAPCTYTLNGGPTGLSVTGAGVITGTVGGTAQTYPAVSVTVTDADGATATTSNFTWTVFVRPTVTAPPAQTDTIGDSVNLTLTKTCSNAPCTYTLNSGPTGLSVTSAGVITGTVGGTAQTYAAVSVTVTDNDGSSATSTAFTWTVFAKPTVTAPAAQTNLIGDAVSVTLTKSCTNTPCGYVLNNGPTGLSVTSAGVITGTVGGTAQTYSAVSVSVTDADGSTASSATFTWTIQSAITLTTGPQAATTSDSVNVTLAASGGAGAPYTYSVLGNSLPAGLSLSAAGVVTGTPTTVGTYTSQIKIFDKSGIRFGTGSIVWTITSPPLAASNPGNQTATLNTPISPQIQLSASGGSGNYAWTGTLPAGLSLSTGGLITGTPTAAGSTAVTLTVRDTTTGNTRAISFTIAVVAKPTVTAPVAQTGSVGSTVNLQLTTTCPNSPCTYVFNAKAPSGLSISSTGLVTGTISSAAGTYTLITITVTDNDGAVVTSGTFTWTVNSVPTITSPGNQTTDRGDAVTLDMSTLASGGTPAYTYTASGLPTWLHISATTGKITGTAPNANSTTTNIKVTITDTKGAQATTAAFTWNVTDLAWSLPSTISTPLGTDMTGYQASSYVSGGAAGTKTYSATNIPTGLTMSSTGAVTGTTSARGTFNVGLTVVDSVGASESANVTWSVT